MRFAILMISLIVVGAGCAYTGGHYRHWTSGYSYSGGDWPVYSAGWAICGWVIVLVLFKIADALTYETPAVVKVPEKKE